MSSREAFETAMRAEGWKESLATWNETEGGYRAPTVQYHWQGWQMCQNYVLHAFGLEMEPRHE